MRRFASQVNANSAAFRIGSEKFRQRSESATSGRNEAKRTYLAKVGQTEVNRVSGLERISNAGGIGKAAAPDTMNGWVPILDIAGCRGAGGRF